MWKDKRGNWHVLYHRMFDPAGPLDPNWGKEDGSWNKKGGPVPSPGWAGGHAYSRDGLAWSNWTRCYNTSVALVDGTTVNFPRRERPKLLFDKASLQAIRHSLKAFKSLARQYIIHEQTERSSASSARKGRVAAPLTC